MKDKGSDRKSTAYSLGKEKMSGRGVREGGLVARQPGPRFGNSTL